MDLTDSRAGGGGPPDLQEPLQGGGSGDPTIFLRDLGDYPQDREDPPRITPLNGKLFGGDSSKERHVGAAEIPTSGSRNRGSEDRVGGYIFSTPPDHHCPV